MVVPSPEEERFVVIETQPMLSHLLSSWTHASTTEERRAALEEHFRTRPSLSAAEVRVELAKRGVPEVDVDERIAHARRFRQMATGVDAVPFVFERITRIGYCNDDGQEVIRKTARWGPEGQRVFVMRCRVCQHEYGAYGCDADIRRCPRCQDGWTGLPVTDTRER